MLLFDLHKNVIPTFSMRNKRRCSKFQMRIKLKTLSKLNIQNCVSM